MNPAIEGIVRTCYESISSPLVVLDGKAIVFGNSSFRQVFGQAADLEDIIRDEIPPSGQLTTRVMSLGGTTTMQLSIGRLETLTVITFAPASYSRYASEFQQMEVLGKGGFGIVYRALNMLDGQHYAIKKVKLSCDAQNLQDFSDNWFQEEAGSPAIEFTRTRKLSASDHRMLREVKTLASVSNHPNIVRYYNSWIEPIHTHDDEDSDDEDQHHATLYIQMELFSLKDLRRWIHERPQIDLEACVCIIKQLVSALEHIHAQNIVHRDVKPENIFINEHQISLGDFGLAKHLQEYALLQTIEESDVSSDWGTFLYTAPEVLSCQKVTAKADMFSLGVIVFELFSEFKTDMERFEVVKELKSKGTIPPLLYKDYPQFAFLIRKLVSKNPDERPSARDISRLLTDSVLNQSQASPNQSEVSPNQSEVSTNRSEVSPNQSPLDDDLIFAHDFETDSKYSSIPKEIDHKFVMNMAQLQLKS
ncbi:kinase-like domain-containing protein [Gorgonomyces haynaldii]|nr:kinase-like domain-containing protein [Gorgonomyces haynaldii]